MLDFVEAPTIYPRQTHRQLTAHDLDVLIVFWTLRRHDSKRVIHPDRYVASQRAPSSGPGASSSCFDQGASYSTRQDTRSIVHLE